MKLQVFVLKRSGREEDKRTDSIGMIGKFVRVRYKQTKKLLSVRRIRVKKEEKHWETEML